MARTPAAPWDQLRRWIDQQEAWERKNGQTARLSPRQSAAISELVSAVSEPDIGTENYMTQLNRMSHTEPGPKKQPSRLSVLRG